jgi:ABC-type dipeptide/oligopeptide/nickel transport system permease subunit
MEHIFKKITARRIESFLVIIGYCIALVIGITVGLAAGLLLAPGFAPRL